MTSRESLASGFRRLIRSSSIALTGGIRPDEYGLPYFDHIISTYLNTEYDRADPISQKIVSFVESVRTKRLSEPQSLTLSDVFSVERATLRLQNLDSLRARAWELREQYRTVFGEDMMAVYQRSAHDPSLATVDQLRSDLLRLLDAFHWRYTFGPIREQALNDVSQRLIWLMGFFLIFVVLAVGIDFMRWGTSNQTVSLVPLVMFAGAAGASISLQNRLQRIPTTGDSIINLFALKHGQTSLFLNPIMGALFALFAYLLFVSGFVTGDIFPKVRISEVTGNPRDYHSFGSYLYSMAPIDSRNFAKLLIFCFIAGFAERLIPDALDRLVEKKANSLTGQMLTSDSLKDVLSGLVAKTSEDKAAAETEETKKRKASEETAAREKANAEQEATRKKAAIEINAAEAKTNLDEQAKEEVEKQAAADKAAAETEATRKKEEADLRAAALNADAASKATQKKKDAEERGLAGPTDPTHVDPDTPPLEPQKSPNPVKPTSPPQEEPKKR